MRAKSDRWTTEYPALVDEVLARSTGAASRDHGEHHWQLVGIAGAELLPHIPGADPDVVFCFALFHDSMRENDYVDPDHGKRGGALARDLLGGGGLLDKAQLDDLVFACDHHTSARVSDDPTIGGCWDSDRLNLWRVAIEPAPHLMSTVPGKDADRIRWADELQEKSYTWAEVLEIYGRIG